MKIVRTYATSANLGPGFDSLGAVFDLYNEYSFEVSCEFSLKNMKPEFCNDENLIVKAYKMVFEKLNKPIVPLKIEALFEKIPEKRGLGSSAACIGAGILMANDVLGNILSKEEMISYGTILEGHPDNISPLILGGMVCSFQNEKIISVKINIQGGFNFYAFIPEVMLSTKKAREVLPKMIKMSDATFNISHVVGVIKAFETSDFDLLKESLKDKIHEQYRLKLIENGEKLFCYLKEKNAIPFISGAGSTIMAISKSKLTDDFLNFKLKKLDIIENGAYVYERK